MKLVSWNVNGIRSVLQKGFLEFLRDENPDLFAVQEIKATAEQVELDLGEYYIIWNPAERKGYAGTAIFTKVKPINQFKGMGILDSKLKDEYGDASKEGRVITLEYDNFYLVNVYTPNSKSDLSRLKFRYAVWDPSFLVYLKDLEKHKPVIFCGDMNVAHKEIDLARPNENRNNAGFTDEEREGFDKLLKSGFIDTFRYFNNEGGNYTWWSNFFKAREKNIGWRIDYFGVSNTLEKALLSADIKNLVMGSDHCPITLEINLDKNLWL
ncbi:exodeoxyribonuclease III [Candidatus Dojkabacteria bacterium]|uniref:Exodeoxyribonuclease III n=1 Tax=Candidatus Dojkabacteria bacterium TaxID=2099670 RepID=A0A3M0Z165_9BACT|nr:MAG: exodeoxyribonuclease III [Candidatus Dojkabacteria bacterium]